MQTHNTNKKRSLLIRWFEEVWSKPSHKYMLAILIFAFYYPPPIVNQSVDALVEAVEQLPIEDIKHLELDIPPGKFRAEFNSDSEDLDPDSDSNSDSEK